MDLYVCAGRLDVEHLLKSPLIYRFHISIWGLGALSGGAKPTKAPVATGVNPAELPISDEA